MKRCFSALLCLLLLLLLLTGCAQETPLTEPSEPSVPPQTAAPVSTEPPPPQLEPINPVSSVVYDAPYSFQLLDRRTAAVMRFEYSDEEYTDSVTHLDIVDLYTGTVTATTALDDSEYFTLQSPVGGLLLMENYESSFYRILDAQLNTVRIIQVPQAGGIFNADLSRYYYSFCGILHVLDTATGTAEPVPAAADYRFSALEGFDPDTNTILGTIRTSIYDYGTCSIIFNPDTGETLLLSDIYGFVTLTASGICTEVYDSELEASVFRFSDLSGPTFLEIPPEIVGSDRRYLSTVTDSDYFYATAYGEESATECDLYHAGDTLTVYPLDMTQFTEGLLSLVQSPDGNLVGMIRCDGGYCFCILCPDQLPFEEVCQPSATEIPLVDPAVLDSLTAEQNLAVPEHLTDLRTRADALEETYGITILLSSQCEIPASNCGFAVTTTDDSDWMDEMDEHMYIDNSLNELQNALKLYPEGFFRQFRNKAGEYGMLFLLVEHFESQNNTIGVHYTIGDWNCVAIDISYTYALTTYCHEIWHATEVKINSDNFMLLDEESWNTNNPEGFSYSLDETLEYLNHTEWTYLSGYGEDSYFVDSYARVNGKEDRARLMEYVMAEDQMAREMMEAPALRKKLQIMSDALRQAFDTTGWENVYWERYLSE